MRIVKLLSAFLGVTIVIGSLGLLGAGAVALAVPDQDGYLSTGSIALSTDSIALVGRDLEVLSNDWGPIEVMGLGARIEVDSRNGKPVFFGIGPADRVEDYLSGARYATVDFTNDRVRAVGSEGVDRIAPPGDEGFWVAGSSDGNLAWDVQTGRWAIAVLNADGTPGVDVEVSARTRVPFVRPLGVALVVTGLIGLGLGVLLTYFGVRSRPAPAGAPAPSPVEDPVDTTAD